SIRLRQFAVVLVISVVAVATLLVSVSSLAQQPDSRPRTTGTATQTPAQTPQTGGPGRRIAPQLGAPPPPPILKPKPTPPPDPNSAEIDEGSRLVMNTELVTLNVRVID